MVAQPLITPLGSNFLKDFPSQHAVNMNLIDAYARACLTTHPLKTYDPQWLATTTNPTLGTGGIAVKRGFYYEIWDQIYTWGEVRFGTTGASGGTGNYSITLPFPAISNYSFGSNIGNQRIIGTGTLWDDSTPANRQPVSVHLKNSNEIAFSVKLNSGAGQREVSNTVPYAVAASDGISWNAFYQRVPS